MGLFGGRKREKRLEVAGVNSQAVLVAFREVGQQNFTPLVDLTLRITPADGSGLFEVTARTQVPFSQVGSLKPGDAFAVRYDPEDHDNWELGDKISSAGGPGDWRDGATSFGGRAAGERRADDCGTSRVLSVG
jgi:hypothetical protein